MKTVRRVAALLLFALLLGGCLGGGGDEPDPPSPQAKKVSDRRATTTTEAEQTTVPDSPSPTEAPAPAPAPAASASGTPNVIAGVVRNEQGAPIAGAKIRVTGYTGKPNGLYAADTIKDAVTDSRGEYRLQVPSGLYGITGSADLAFDGKTYKELYLHPVDGSCEKQMSDRGITKDFVLKLSGFQQCWTNPDRNNAGFYSGAATLLFAQGTLADDARLTFTLTPVGKLADGSTGKPVTFTRTWANLHNGFGPLDTTSTLHDIPLGKYRLSGTAAVNGGRLDLRFAPNVGGSAASAVTALDISFPAKQMLPYGIGQAEIAVYAGGGDAPAPSPAPTAAPAPAPEPSPEPTSPPEPKKCYSPHVGEIPC
jgi:hypothetical protein